MELYNISYTLQNQLAIEHLQKMYESQSPETGYKYDTTYTKQHFLLSKEDVFI